MNSLDDIEKRLSEVEKRNAKVTADKAWETSVTRRACISGLTYLVVVCFLIAIHKAEPFINALVPVIGYLLSTLALAGVKAEWVNRLLRRGRD